MAGPSYVLDKTYEATTAVTKYAAVVPYANDGSADGQCKLPGGASVPILGITQEAQANAGQNVTVRKLGISRAVASGAVNAGNLVEVAGTDGSLRATTPAASAAAVHYIVGMAESSAASGAIFFVNLAPMICGEAS
jgi:hypothetical protein